jgi:hypothetical protein
MLFYVLFVDPLACRCKVTVIKCLRSLTQTSSSTSFRRKIVKKVKCTLVQALWPCTGRTARGGGRRGIVLPFHDLGTRRGWRVGVTPRPLFNPAKEPVPNVQEERWTPGPVRKISLLPGFDPRTVQPVASSYTVYATRLPTDTKLLKEFHFQQASIKINCTGCR